MVVQLLLELFSISLVVALLYGVWRSGRPIRLAAACERLVSPAVDPSREVLAARTGSFKLTALLAATFAAATGTIALVLRHRAIVGSFAELVDAFDAWDVGWYRSIATEGYHGDNLAFWPLFPHVTRLVANALATSFSRAGTL